MSLVKRQNIFVVGVVAGLLVLSMAQPAGAQSEFGPLFDKFNFKLAGSWVALSTEIRLDSETTGRGTVLSFEDDLNLGKSEIIPTLAFDWQIARKHKIGIRWQDIKRDASSQALTEIKWGDEIIPVNASINLGFDISQYFVDYTYYPWGTDRWAFGFGGGLRVMEIGATLTYSEDNSNLEGGTDIKGTGPLPYLYFEYRRLFSDDWRFITGLGWLYVEVGDIKGGQWIGRAGVEYLAGNRWSFGVAANLATINVDWKGIETDAGDSLLTAAIDMAVNDVTAFVRVRF